MKRKTEIEIECQDINLGDLFYRMTADGHVIKGTLLKALENEQSVLLKNIDEAKPGSFDQLRMIIKFVTGEIDTLTVLDPYKQNTPLKFYKNQIKDFNLAATARNPEKLPESFLSGLQPLLAIPSL